MRRGKGWRTVESVLACRAWIQASEDPYVGTSQIFAMFSNRVGKRYDVLVNEHV